MDEINQIKKEYDAAKSATNKFSTRWNEFLDLAYAKIPNVKGFKSRVSTGDLSNLLIERNARVASKIPTGKIVPLSQDDGRKATALNLAWNNYILQRANWQYPMNIKLRMWDYYSLVYGISVMFHGYHIDSNYTGPDCRLVDLRFVFPQAGRLSPNDVDFVFYETFHSKNELKKMLGEKGWNAKNLRDLIESKNDPNLNGNQTSNLQNERGENENLYGGMVKLITKYQKGKNADWITIDENGNEIRRIKNPFESGRIPFVFKMAFPLIDSFWGLGDIERGESLQKAINSITNLSLDYLKILIFPPMAMNQNMNRSLYPMKPGAIWRYNKQAGDFIEPANLNQAPASIVQQLNQSFKGSLMNQNGTTDTTIGADSGLPGFGKTPEALKKLDERESSRDNYDRQMYESACKELFEGMLEELGTRQKLPIEFELFEKEIKDLEAKGFEGEELTKLNDDYAKFKIKAEDLKGGYKFLVDIGSSAENDSKEEFERIKAVIDMVEGSFGQKAIEELEKRGETLDYKLLLEQFLKAANVQNREQMIIPKAQPEEEMMEEKPQNPRDYSQDFDPSMITDPKLQDLMKQGEY